MRFLLVGIWVCFLRRAGGCASQCTGVGNDTHPVGHFKSKKKPFGARRLSKKERSRSR